MWTPTLERQPDGRKIGWVLVNEAGERYCHPEGSIVTGFTRDEMQALADRLNGE